MPKLIKQLQNFFDKNNNRYLDCGEINCTLLVEEYCHENDLYNGNDIPEELFEAAIYVKL